MDSPRALNIVAVNGGRLEAANLSVLQEILLGKGYADKPLAVISVAGAMREGKSYLMNGFVNRQEIGEKWFTANTPMDRFQFKGGSTSCTTGIDICSKPYIVKKGGKEMVVLFMDTQGVFDQDHTAGVQTNVFALSILLSSIQIFNKKNLINGNDLNYLQLFTHMAKAGQTEDNKMFQKLLFLIRDFTEEEGISFNDGEDYKKTIIFKDARNSDTRALQKDIQSSFKEIECCMFPDPGRKFKQMKSQPSDYFGDEEFELFRAAFIRFVEHVMASVEPKQLNGLDMTCREFLALYEKLITYFNSGKAPEAKTLLQAMAETNISSYLQRAKNEYDTLMNSPEAKNPKTFLEANNAARTAAENFFGQCKAMGSEQLLEQSGNDLMEYMTIQFDKYRTEMQRDIDAATIENILIYTRNQLKSCNIRSVALLETVLENIVKTTKETFDGRTIVADSVPNTDYDKFYEEIKREIDAKTAIVAAYEKADQEAEAAKIEKAQLVERQKHQEEMFEMKLSHEREIARYELDKAKAKNKEESDKQKAALEAKIKHLEQNKEGCSIM